MTRFLSLLGLLFAMGCKKSQPAETHDAPLVSAKATASVSAPAASASAASAPVPKSSIHCKALEKKKLVAIGARGGEAHGLVATNGHVYTFAHESARATLLAIPRNGDKPKPLGRIISANPPESLVVDEHAAYFTSAKKLLSLPLTGGEPKELAKDFSTPIALAGEAVYGVRCVPERKVDELVRIPTAGGEVSAIASFPRAAGKCEFRYLTLDASTAYVSDWTTRRILGISLSSGALTELAQKRPFPGRIAVGSDSIAFQSAAGIHRVPKGGGAVTLVTDYGTTPFETIAWDERDFYVLHTLAYAERETLARIPQSGGKPAELEFFRVADVTMGGGQVDVAVDEECVYLAHNGGSFLEVLARPKP